MALKRTTVYAEAEDLAVIKAAAARRGTTEAEIIREAIHLAAMANRAWAEPFFIASYPGTGSLSPEEVRSEQARTYEATKRHRE
ncbi:MULTISPECIES: CopG family transcriptional regulator [unclassified Kitasatospora]|uniref:ribbon-helix-helix domain-containing protein n=1 Tax=unclassified Kitasatospora TaxID=2633591 RepID=UPI00070FB10A|nr:MULTISPECIES: CopG family transcriptional regulator [unclassified Kitasatospora]KQV04662.1 hypothetical protein ASC99_14855 [Kitasatospora sp. Root107]KRB60812.1 hypothetical protein ASE03_10660 [Kitasatospora sp. Root187]